MIGEKTIAKMKAMAAEQLDSYSGKMDAAFLKAEDGKLTVSLSFALSVSKIKGGLDVDTTIGFTESKVRDTIKDTVVENQVEIPLGAADRVYRMER